MLFVLEISQDFFLCGKMYLWHKTLSSSETSKPQCAFDLNHLCELPQHFESSLLFSICIWFLRFQARVPSRPFDPRSLALGNSEELLGLLFCSSAGVAVLCCVFCLSPCLKQPQFSPKLQLSVGKKMTSLCNIVCSQRYTSCFGGKWLKSRTLVALHAP